MTKRLATCALFVVAALWIGAASAAERVLLRVESSADPKAITLNITERAGLQFFASPAPHATWKLLPGDAISGRQQPVERVVELYTGTPQSPVLLCFILLRYYRVANSWVPHLQLQQDPLVAFVNGEWKPVELAPGLTAAIVQHGNTLPNPEGFFPRLEIGLRSGPLALIGWKVRAP